MTDKKIEQEVTEEKKLEHPEDGNERCPICGVFECQEPNPRR